MAEEKRKFNLNMPKYPSNADAERSVLASLMLDRTVAIELLVELVDDDFFEPQHKVILSAMKQLDADNRDLDFVNLIEQLERTANLEKAGGMEYISDLTQYIATAAGCRQHFEILKKLSLLRGLLDASKHIAENVYTSNDADKSLEYAQNAILDIAKTRTGSSLVHLSGVVNEVVRNYEQTASSDNRVTGLLTGYSNLDGVMNGLQKSDVIVLAARPGVGKTAFALSIACNIARNKEYADKKILIFSLEMGSQQLAERMLCNVGKVDNRKVRHVELDSHDYVRFHRAMDTLAGSQIYLDQTAETNPNQIFSKCKQFSLEHGGVDLIIIDYLQLMDAGDADRSGSRQYEIAYISRRIKLLAKQLNVPIILLSQLSRGAELRGEKPQLHDLRDSGTIEQDADIVMFLHKEKGQPKEETYIELIIAKYRAGEQGSHAFRWDGPTFTFTPVDPDILYHLKKEGEDDTAGGNSPKAAVYAKQADGTAAGADAYSAATAPVPPVSDTSIPFAPDDRVAPDTDIPFDAGSMAAPQAPEDIRDKFDLSALVGDSTDKGGNA